MMRERHYAILVLVFSAFVSLEPVWSPAQTAGAVEIAQTLPSAPMPQMAASQGIRNLEKRGPTTVALNQNQPSAPNQTTANPPSTIPPTGPQTNRGTPAALSLKEAEALAIKNNPQISVARLLALASHQVTREVRASLYPTAVGNITGVDSEAGSRITAGFLTNPTVYERAAGGVTVTQLIIDFGRTYNLISSANYAEKAENENAVATKEQTLLAVDKAFFSALQAQAVLTVAQQTVKARQAVADQVGALYKSKLKSELDFSFANVNLAQAQLLLLDAENNQNATEATLSMVLGYPTQQSFRLLEETGPVPAPPPSVDTLIAGAFSTRPEILALQFQYQSAKKFQAAERDLLFPTLQAIGAVGFTPVGNPVVAPNASALNNSYGAVGANLAIPLFNGFQYFARAKEASLKAQAADERLRDMRDLIARDVRTSWLNANTAYQRLSVTQQLLEQAKLGLDLAQARYKLGLGSIVELSQAQLQETEAEISYAQAGYDYRLSLAILAYETTGI